MDKKALSRTLDKFIASDAVRVAALSGDWGVGKTFFWRTYIQELTSPDQIFGISYASLFGASSVAELRSKVTEGLEMKVSREVFKDRYESISEQFLVKPEFPKKTIGVLEKIRGLGWHGVLAESAYWFVRDCIVCLDDIERCGAGLDSRALMGFIDELRERNCKVVMILNRDQLKSQNIDIETYWEKIVDLDIRYRPDVCDNAKIAFPDSYEYPEYGAWSTKELERLECSNIRIQKRVASLIRELAPSLEGLRGTLKKEVIEHATILSWALLNPNFDVSPEIIGSPKFSELYVAVIRMGDSHEKLSDEEEEWAKIVEQTGYSPSVYDQYIGQLIVTGWCEESDMLQALTQVNNEEKVQQAGDALREVFSRYRSDFNLDASRYLSILSGVLEVELENLACFDFDAGIQAIEHADGDTKELVSLYLERRGDHLQAVAEHKTRDRLPLTPALREEIESREEKARAQRFSIDSVVGHLIDERSWGPEHMAFLAKQEPTAYQAWILKNPDDLERKIKKLLSFRNSQENPYAKIVENLEGGLRLVAGRNKFDSNRVKEVYGVRTEEELPD